MGVRLVGFLQVVVALAFLASGAVKLRVPRERLALRLAWVRQFTDRQVKLIGAAEVLGAAGLVVPGVFGLSGPVTPVVASALAVLMVGALIVHVRRRETDQLPGPAVLLALCLVIVAARLGPYPQ